jgi:Ca-activated chloride channel homolog
MKSVVPGGDQPRGGQLANVARASKSRLRSPQTWSEIIMNRLFASLSIVLLGLSLAFVSSAQNPQPPSRRPTASPTPSPTPDSDIVDVNIRRVRLPITVQDKKKQFVSGLTQGDFLILEDKVPQTIDSFTSEANNNLPLYVAVLMDTSPSTAAKMKFQQEAAMNFIQTVVRPRRDRVLFATFDHEVTLRQDFTDRLELLDKAVYAVKKTGEKTALWDAIWQFSDQKMRSVPGRRVIVVITDGTDTYSRADLNDAIDIAQRTETTIFAISTKAGLLSTVVGVDAGTVKGKSDKDLDRLAEETGGSAFYSGDMLTLERSLTAVAKELRSQYLITYRSTNDKYDGSYRRVEVKLTNRDGLKLRTKKGYKAVADAVRTGG